MSTGVLLRSCSRNVPKIFYQSVRSATIRGYWPEPVTQQALSKFLEDINYFEEPKRFVNIGLEIEPLEQPKLEQQPIKPDVAQLGNHGQVDQLLDKLSVELEPPPLSYDDIRVGGRELGALAVYAGIYRDLFGSYNPDRNDISFTPEQAKRLGLLVPHHWITDQPNARIEHFPKEPQPLMYFEPVVDVSARFVSIAKADDSDHTELVANSSYYGNIIAARDALEKPSITLDGKRLNLNGSKFLTESQFNNWSSGTVELANFPSNCPKYHTIILANLDSLHEGAANLHWMLANIRPSEDGKVIYDELCDYLPVFGIRGFGYSRYVFLVLQHDQPIDAQSTRINEFSLQSRRFDAKKFLEQHQASVIKPVGLSWFQTSWDLSSNGIFHNYLEMKAPVYEHVQAKNESRVNPPYAGGRPFNTFLDNCRSKKSINEQVLLERLKSVDPTDYKDQYVPPRVPPTVFRDEQDMPTWMYTVMMKKKNKVGYWRGLRPASAILPLDNNADLDHPIRPLESSRKIPPEFPNQYRKIPRRQLIKDMPISLPPNEHRAVYVQEDHDVHLKKVMEVMESFKEADSKTG